MQIGLYVNGHVYLAYSPRLNIYKIGRTINLEKRLPGLKHWAADKNIRYIHTIRSKAADILEDRLHQVFSDKEHRSLTEWYHLSPNDIDLFKSF